MHGGSCSKASFSARRLIFRRKAIFPSATQANQVKDLLADVDTDHCQRGLSDAVFAFIAASPAHRG
jgi:hypothetical protein